MGIFDRFFSKDSRDERFIKKHVSRVLSKYAQKELREESMILLAQRGEKGDTEAIYGLLQRLTYNHPEPIVDENEKQRVLFLLDRLGEEAVAEPLRRYLRDERQAEVAMALIALERLEGEEKAMKEILYILSQGNPDDAWSSDRKLQLVNHLDNFESPEIVEPLLPYLKDLNDDVVFRSLDLLEKVGTDEQIRDAVIEVAIDESTSARILARVLDMVRDRKWFIGEHRKDIEPNLPDGYYFDKRDNIKTRD